jgi:hypothetical protein
MISPCLSWFWVCEMFLRMRCEPCEASLLRVRVEEGQRQRERARRQRVG